jgi:hypothetical protein
MRLPFLLREYEITFRKGRTAMRPAIRRMRGYLYVIE